MKLTAISPDEVTLVLYEWTVNDVILTDTTQTTQTIEADVSEGDVVSVRAQNDCGSWSQPVTLKWGLDVDDLLLYAVIFIGAFALFRSR